MAKMKYVATFLFYEDAGEPGVFLIIKTLGFDIFPGDAIELQVHFEAIERDPEKKSLSNLDFTIPVGYVPVDDETLYEVISTILELSQDAFDPDKGGLNA